jgi:hypothetical protein
VEEGESSKELKDPLVVTGFVEWCARHFAEPAASNEDFQINIKPNHEKELTIEFEVQPQLEFYDFLELLLIYIYIFFFN